jgi:hypothetical protein
VHPFDERVGGEHFQLAANRRRDGRIVADADDERARFRETGAYLLNERAFAKLPGRG